MEIDENKKNRIRSIKNNEDDDSPIISFVQMEGYYYCCGKQGHKSPNYNIKSKYQKKNGTFIKYKNNNIHK